jgi:hypothetical protein
MAGDANARLRAELRLIIRRNREAFEGEYGPQITALLGLSREQLDAITPDTTDLAVYDQLVEVVKDASRKNLSAAQLRARIKALGGVAVAIAKQAGVLAALG